MSDYERARSALAHVSSEEREVWIRVGMALRALLGDAGRDLFMEWSSGASSYSERDALTAWKSFRAARGVGPGTLFYYAKQGGWRPERCSSAPFPRQPKPSAPKGDERASLLRSRKTARAKWHASAPVPLDPVHPVRRWTSAVGAKRGVWPADLAWPLSLHWLPRSRERSPDYDGAGSLLALLAPISHWRGKSRSLPVLPDSEGGVHGVLSVRLLADGRQVPAPHSKKGWGRSERDASGKSKNDLVGFVGREDPDRPVGVAEGIADALAVETWAQDASGCYILRSTSGGFVSAAVAETLARRPAGVLIFGDEDPAGNKAAEILSANVRKRGGSAAFVPLPDGCADPAEAARAFAERAGWT